MENVGSKNLEDIPEAKRESPRYYKLGNNLLKREGTSVLFFLNEDRKWEEDFELHSYFMGSSEWEPELLKDEAAAKATFEELAPGRVWVP